MYIVTIELHTGTYIITAFLSYDWGLYFLSFLHAFYVLALTWVLLIRSSLFELPNTAELICLEWIYNDTLYRGVPSRDVMFRDVVYNHDPVLQGGAVPAEKPGYESGAQQGPHELRCTSYVSYTHILTDKELLRNKQWIDMKLIIFHWTCLWHILYLVRFCHQDLAQRDFFFLFLWCFFTSHNFSSDKLFVLKNINFRDKTWLLLICPSTK